MTETDDEQIAADAETAIADQTPVAVRVAYMRLPDGARYLAVTTKTDKNKIMAMMELSRRIMEESDVKTEAYHRASLCYENARELAYVYELMERPMTDSVALKEHGAPSS